MKTPRSRRGPPTRSWPASWTKIEDALADILARRDVEDRLEQRIAEKMQERHEEYVKELKMQVLKEDGGPDNAQTLKKFAELQKLEQRKLANSILKSMRPKSVDEIVGQETARKALFSKIASPYPQHVLLYGPPGSARRPWRGWRWSTPKSCLLRLLTRRRGSSRSTGPPCAGIRGR